jgi:hypothetical protein
MGTTTLVTAIYAAGSWQSLGNLATNVANVSGFGRPASLAALSDGRVAIAFPDTSSKIEVAYLSGGSWTTPAPVPGVTPVSNGVYPVSLAPGLGTDVLELAYINASGALAVVSETSAGTWSTPTVVDSSQSYSVVSIAVH